MKNVQNVFTFEVMLPDYSKTIENAVSGEEAMVTFVDHLENLLKKKTYEEIFQELGLVVYKK